MSDRIEKAFNIHYNNIKLTFNKVYLLIQKVFHLNKKKYNFLHFAFDNNNYKK